MKKLFLLLTMAGLLSAADTKAEAELKEVKRKLAEVQAALLASEARAKVGTQKLTEAVTDGAEASKENGKKIEAVSGQIEAAKDSVETQAKLNERATRRLAETVASSTGKMTSAITEQTHQQAHAAAGARDIARKVERTNLATTRAQEANVSQIAELKASIAKLTQAAELKDASNQTAIQLAKIQASSSAYAPIATILIAIFGVAGIWIQSRHGGKLSKISTVQDDIKTQVNGNLSDEKEARKKAEEGRRIEMEGREKAEAEVALLRQQLESLLGKKP